MVYSYLMSFRSFYDDLRKHILRSDKLPKFEQVVGMVNKEYAQRKMAKENSTKREIKWFKSSRRQAESRKGKMQQM